MSVRMSVCLSVHHIWKGGGLPREMERVDRKEGGNGKEGFLHVWRGVAGEIGRGYFTNGMPGWRYFSRATPGHPASITTYHSLGMQQRT